MEADRTQQVHLGTAMEVKVQGVRQTLSDKEQLVAGFLLSDPKELISLSISALAARCGVSETVIIRFYRKLGYQGFHEFKIEIAQSLTEGTPDVRGDLRAGDDVQTIKHKVFAVTRQALEDAEDAIDAGALQQVCELLLEARRVVVIALGGSAPVGLDLVHKLLKLGIIAAIQADSHMQAMAASVLRPGDVLFAISHSGNSRDIIEAVQRARQQGARTVLLTGFPHSPAAKAAEITLYAPCRETKYQTDAMTSRIVQMAIVDALYVAITFANKEQGTAYVHETSVAAAKKKL